MELKLIFWIFIIHFVADFLLQTDWQAKNKSSDSNALWAHTFVYSTTIAVLAIPFINEVWQFFFLFYATLLCHTGTDFITSRISKKYFDKQDYHNGFVIVGLDQVLHYIQLFLTFNFILN